MSRPGALAGALLMLAALPPWVAAQVTCRPGADSNEGRTLARMSLPVDFSPAGLAGPLPAWRTRLGLEVAYIPDIDSTDAIPTACRPGKDSEQVNLIDVAIRPRLELGLPGGVLAEVGWIPPLTVSGVRANVLGLAVQWWPDLGLHSLTFAIRGHLTTGWVEASITCPAAALEDPGSECFLGEPSSDRFEPFDIGLEAAIRPRTGTARLFPHIAAGVARLSPEFQVDFTDQFGDRDTTRVAVDLTRMTAGAGLTWLPTPAIALSAEADALIGTGVTGRVAARWVPGR